MTIRSILGVLCAFVLGASVNVSGQSKSDPSQQLQSVTHTLQNGAVTRIEVIAMPKGVESLIGMTPELLQSHCWVKVSLLNLNSLLSSDQSSLTSALQKTQVVQYAGTSDLRRGLIFYAKDRVVASIYFDQFGQGLVNGVRGKFSGVLLKWVEIQLPPDYR